MRKKSMRKRLGHGEFRIIAKGNRRSNAFWRALPGQLGMPVPVQPRRSPFDRGFDPVQTLFRHNYAIRRGYKQIEEGSGVLRPRRVYGGRGRYRRGRANISAGSTRKRGRRPLRGPWGL